MNTTIDIPEPLYREVQIRAVEERTTVGHILIRGLERELRTHPQPACGEKNAPYFARRKLLPGFARLQQNGAFRPKPEDRDITDVISDDRDGR